MKDSQMREYIFSGINCVIKDDKILSDKYFKIIHRRKSAFHENIPIKLSSSVLSSKKYTITKIIEIEKSSHRKYLPRQRFLSLSLEKM